MPIIDVHGLTRTYGSGRHIFTAVDSVSFTVERGELVALLGVNGAGKTSLVEMVEGTAPPSSGRVTVLGHDPIRERSHVRPHTGIMLQEAGFAGALTVMETLRMWCSTLSHPRPVSEALELTGLDARAHVRVKSLSGGERRRLDLALAILGRPDILFLDEPTTGLDPASRRRTWDLVRNMLNEGVTILLTTHYLEEAEELADRVLIMAEGRIHASGTVSEIVSQHPSRISFRCASFAHETSQKTKVSHCLSDENTGLRCVLSDADLAGLRGLVCPVRSERGGVHIETRDLQATLTDLLNLAKQRGIIFDGLEARSASLEQAFLAISSAHNTGEALGLPSTQQSITRA